MNIVKKSLVTDENELLADFTHANYTASRIYGGLVFVSVKMFQTIIVVENVVAEHFDQKGHMYIRDTFQD